MTDLAWDAYYEREFTLEHQDSRHNSPETQDRAANNNNNDDGEDEKEPSYIALTYNYLECSALCFCFVIVLLFLNSAGLNIGSPLKLDNTLPLSYNLNIFTLSKIFFMYYFVCIGSTCECVPRHNCGCQRTT